MRVSPFGMFGSFLLLASPVVGQTTSTLLNPPPGAAVTLDTQQKLKQSLEKNGFKHVVVIPGADLIRAQAPDGSNIVMEITPDHVAGVVGSGSTADQTTTHSPKSGGFE